MEFLHTENGVLCQGTQPIILRGMGLGGWLLPEGYMWKFYTKCDRPRRMEALIQKLCGAEYAGKFWTQYYNAFITEKDIAWIAERGLNSVRLAMNSRHLFEMEADGSVSFNEKTLSHVDHCVAWCRQHGLYVFLDMHGAPGGQTGQNIDDSENDIPELFTDERNQDVLVEMWRLLAMRYWNEPAVGGYDLLNEPLPKWNSQYNHLLLPLYRRLISVIREVDQKHVIILEGAHWATDFSVFDEFTKEEAADNIVLQFHKYWSDPDEESISAFVEVGKRLNVPLWMGEGGENNLQWYTYAFPMYERLGIGWCFWSYKKMEVPNSPVTFAQPDNWNEIIAFLDGGVQPDPDRAKNFFDAFLACISQGTYHPEIVNALVRHVPVEIPAAAFDAEQINSIREEGVHFRKTSRATLLFADGHMGDADWRRYGGEPQPEEEKIVLKLHEGDAGGYHVDAGNAHQAEIKVLFQGTGKLKIQNVYIESQVPCVIDVSNDGIIWLTCAQGEVLIESLYVF